MKLIEIIYPKLSFKISIPRELRYKMNFTQTVPKERTLLISNREVK